MKEKETIVNLVIEPTLLEHNVQIQIDETGFTPQILVGSEPRDPSIRKFWD